MAEKQKENSGFMRLDKLLAEMGHGSRSQIRQMAKKGRIQVNGQVEKAADRKVDMGRDTVLVDGIPVRYVEWEYYMLNKPQGVVSATEDGRYPTVVSLIKSAVRKDLFPVGRLDIDTEGLLLITNDGAMAHSLLSPKKHVDKVYLAHIQGRLPGDAAERFAEGIVLEDGTRTLPARLRVMARREETKTEPCTQAVSGQAISSSKSGMQNAPGQVERKDCASASSSFWDAVAELTVYEGRFHQVKRMFEAVGCRVIYLKRLSMGPLKLDEALPTGGFRPLKAEEIEELKRITQ